MLCDACAQHFTFEDTKGLLWRKKDALKQAFQQNFNYPEIKSLKNEHDRYRHALESSNGKSPFPSLYGTKAGVQYPFLGSYAYPVWSLDKRRVWHELRTSSAFNGCDLCRRLVAMAQNNTSATIGENATISSHWFLDGYGTILDWLCFDVNDKSNILTIRFHTAFEHNKQKKKRAISLALSSTSTKDKGCVDFLSKSLQNCLDVHKTCSLRQDNWLPTRLLDVRLHRDDRNSVRVIESGSPQMPKSGPETRYVTLSHVWGMKHPLSLTRSNYNELRSRIDIETMPQCFSNAVYIVRQLGISFLWIDSLCIIQDMTEDWTRESAVMGKVYTNGLCNVAACDGAASNCSIFTERDSCLGEPLIVSHEYSDQSVRFTLLPDWVNLTWDTAPLYRRGWVLQERFLSSRVMHFSKFPFWECREELSREISSSHRELQSLYFPSLPEPQRSWLASTMNADEAVLHWWKLVKLYTKCSLTYGTDKLIALSGIAQTMSKMINEPYYAGIWGGKYFVLGLAWRVNRGSLSHGLGSKNYRAPSWS